MKAFIQFYTKNLAGETMEALGTDGVFILDGRNNLDTMIFDGQEQAYSLHRIHKYEGFKVIRGSSFYSENAMTDMIKLDYEHLTNIFGV